MTPADPGLFERYLAQLLRPLARVLIAFGVTAPAFYRHVKKAYVDAAVEDLGSNATDSRINVLTGVHRRDVRSFREETATEASESRKISILTTVVGRWMAADGFQDETGPRPLPRQSEDDRSFDALVRSVSRDIRPRTVLDELLRQGAVDVIEGHVHLRTDGLVGSADLAQRLHFFAHHIADHLNAAGDNLTKDPPPHLERAVFYNRLSPASIALIEAEARMLGPELLQRLNRLAADRQAQDAPQEGATHRLRFGIYLYTADETEEERTRDAGK